MNTELAKFLAADERPEGTMIYPELYGFLFALVASPELIAPSEWLPLVFFDKDPAYKDEAEEEAVVSAILDAYNEINETVLSDEPKLPDWIEVLEPLMDNFAEEAPLTYWAKGFISGHDWLLQVWESLAPEEMDNELGSCVMVLSFFADTELAGAYAKECGGDEALSVESLAETVVDSFNMAMASYAHMGRSIYEGMLEAESTPFEREGEKVGRNDPCPCGSGNKFKKCCLH